MFEKFSQLANAIAATVLFLGLNIVANQLLVNLKIDMTEDRLYTLSSGTKTIIERIQEPIDLKLYFSIKRFAGYPELLSHGNLVRDMLEEYVSNSDGNLKLSIVDPEPFSEAEDEARNDGIRQLSIAPNATGYLGMVATDSTDGKIIIPFLNPGEETNLEYDLSKTLQDLIEQERKTVGLITTLPLMGPVSERSKLDGQPKTWAIFEILKENFNVVPIKFDSSRIPGKIDVLLVIHPKNLPNSTKYALDQYVLGGGKLIMFVDPLAEGDPTSPDPTTPGVLPNLSSDPEDLLASWGIKMIDKKVVGDPQSAVKVNFGTPEGPRKIVYLPWLQIRDPYINEENPFTRGLSVLNVGTAGSLEIESEMPELTFQKLFSATTNSGLLDGKTIIQIGTPSELFDRFEKDDLSHTLAVHVSGIAKSYLLVGQTTNEIEGSPESQKGLTSGKIDILIVADTDILSDRFWTDPRRYSTTGQIQPFSSNADFLVNAIEIYSGGSQLINLRNRGEFARPFEVVEELRRKAEAAYRDQEKELNTKLQDTENRLITLENSSGEGMILSEEQKAEIDRFRLEQSKTRKELRSVQHKLIQDIEELGNRMKFVNTGLVPLLLLCLGLIVSVRKIYS